MTKYQWTAPVSSSSLDRKSSEDLTRLTWFSVCFVFVSNTERHYMALAGLELHL